MKYKTWNECRVCKGPIIDVLDMGNIYPSNFIDNNNNLETAPLTLSKCKDCGLIQLRHTVELDQMYRQYWYKSGLNKSMVQDLQDVVNNIESRISLNDGDIVVDIGANDGTMLGLYTNKNLFKVGFDPALNLATEALKETDCFINDYFTATAYANHPRNLGKAKVITTIAMFYDLEDPNTFVNDVKKILSDDGIWVIQFTDLLSMLKINAFDNICHEHYQYLSLHDVISLLSKHDIDIFDVSYNVVNGGSLRVYACHRSKRAIDRSVVQSQIKEFSYFKIYDDPIAEFVNRIEEIKFVIMDLIKSEFENGKTIAVMGASTKGNTLLQYFGLDSTFIDHAAEVNKDKFGKKTVGTLIPIISQDESISRKPDYYLVLPWHFENTFVERLHDYMENGGKLIFPMPKPRIIDKDGTHYL